MNAGVWLGLRHFLKIQGIIMALRVVPPAERPDSPAALCFVDMYSKFKLNPKLLERSVSQIITEIRASDLSDIVNDSQLVGDDFEMIPNTLNTLDQQLNKVM
jgi:hypothetical protein